MFLLPIQPPTASSRKLTTIVYKPGNIGNAKTAGLEEDLGLNDSQWAWVLNAFYICYVLCEWTVLFWKLMPAHIYVASLCVL